MKRNTVIYISDMLVNMDRAQAFVRGMSFQRFARDTRTHYAVMRCIEVIGEAAKQVPRSVRDRHPRIPWKAIAGMRDKLIHGYINVNLERVWLVVTGDIPKLKPMLNSAHLRMKVQDKTNSDKPAAKGRLKQKPKRASAVGKKSRS